MPAYGLAIPLFSASSGHIQSYRLPAWVFTIRAKRARRMSGKKRCQTFLTGLDALSFNSGLLHSNRRKILDFVVVDAACFLKPEGLDAPLSPLPLTRPQHVFRQLALTPLEGFERLPYRGLHVAAGAGGKSFMDKLGGKSGISHGSALWCGFFRILG